MTEFTLDNVNFQLRVGSIPLVVTSHPIQNTKARASLIWANCREPIGEEDCLNWGQVSQTHCHPLKDFYHYAIQKWNYSQKYP